MKARCVLFYFICDSISNQCCVWRRSVYTCKFINHSYKSIDNRKYGVKVYVLIFYTLNTKLVWIFRSKILIIGTDELIIRWLFFLSFSQQKREKFSLKSIIYTQTFEQIVFKFIHTWLGLVGSEYIEAWIKFYISFKIEEFYETKTE